jgi:hypothetical protein
MCTALKAYTLFYIIFVVFYIFINGPAWSNLTSGCLCCWHLFSSALDFPLWKVTFPPRNVS